MRSRCTLCVIGAAAAMVAVGQLSLQLGGTGSTGALAAGDGIGPDVALTNSTSIREWGSVGGIQGYSLESRTCNLGDQNLLWGFTHDGTPALGMNAYRFEDGRLVQIGMSWAKHSTNAVVSEGCGLGCNGQGGTVLGVGCLDVYSSNFNGSHNVLGPRSEVDAWTGVMSPAPGGGGSAIFKRLQIAEADLDPALHPDALFYIEGVYVASDDAGIHGNGYNNASYRRVDVSAEFDLTVNGDDQMQVAAPAILAWQESEPSVELDTVDVPGEGRFYVASLVTDLGDGSWRYDYAIFNLNSDRSAGSFSVPVPVGLPVSNIGFHDVDYHSGEVYDNTDWSTQVGATNVLWQSPESHIDNPNSNALRWGTMYNYWFTADGPPTDVAATIGLFKPPFPALVNVTVPGPAGFDRCNADLDGDNVVGFSDLVQMLSAWGPCPGCPEDLGGDGSVGFADLVLLLSVFGPCL